MFILPLAAISAQEDSFSLMSFDIGFGMSYNMVGSGDVGSLQTFGINFRVADPLIIGGVFRRVTVGATEHSSNMLRVKYDLMPMVRAMLSFGNHSIAGGAAAAYTGLGFEIVPFRRQIGGLVTEFKMVTEYLFRPNPTALQGGLENGQLVFGIGVGIGF